MHYSKALPALVLAFATLGWTQDLDSDDYPSQCNEICNPVRALTDTCDDQDNGDGDWRLQCVCTGQGRQQQILANAEEAIVNCQACVAQYDPDDWDEDAYDILTSCSFSTTSFNPTATVAVVSESTTSSVITTTDGAGNSVTSTSVSTTASTGTTTATDAAAQATSEGGAAARGVGSGIGLMAGVVGLAQLI